jgi:hypothetical protein
MERKLNEFLALTQGNWHCTLVCLGVQQPFSIRGLSCWHGCQETWLFPQRS